MLQDSDRDGVGGSIDVPDCIVDTDSMDWCWVDQFTPSFYHSKRTSAVIYIVKNVDTNSITSI